MTEIQVLSGPKMKIIIPCFLTTFVVAIASIGFLQHGSLFGEGKESLLLNPIASQNDPVAEEDEAPEYSVVLALESVGQLEKDIDLFVGKTGVPELMFPVLMFKQYLAGLDKAKPAAMFVFNEDEPMGEYLICLPVSDIGKFKKMLSRHGKVTKGKDTFRFQLSKDDKILARYRDGYVFATDEKFQVDLPENPSKLIREIANSNTLNVKVNLNSFDDRSKQEIIDDFKKGVRKAKNSQIEMNRWMNITETAFKGYILDSEEFSISLNIDDATGNIELASNLIGKNDSRIARQSELDLAIEPSRFSGFLNNSKSALSVGCCSATIGEYFSALKNDTVDFMSTFVEEKSGEKLDDRIIDAMAQLNKVFDDTIESGRTDIAASYFFEAGEENLAVAAYVHDTEPLKRALADFYQLAEAHRKSVGEKAKLTSFEKDGIVYYEMAIEGMDDFYKDVYTPLMHIRDRLVLGVGENAIYIAGRENGREVIQKCHEASSRTTDGNSICLLKVNIKSMAEGLVKAFPSPVAVSLVKKLKPNTNISLATSPIDRGYTTELNVDVQAVTAAVSAVRAIGAVSNEEFEAIANELETAKPRKSRRNSSKVTTGQSRSVKRRGYSTEKSKGAAIRNPFFN